MTSSARPQTTGDSQTRYNVPNAALRGATQAFSKPPVKAKPQTNLYTGGGNGALLAATKVGTTGSGSSRNSSISGTTTATTTTTPMPLLGMDWTGGSARSSNSLRPNASPMRQLSSSSSSSALTVPDDGLADRGPSPSNIAAKLAAARHTASKPAVQASAMPVMSESVPNETEVLPPPGSVGSVLARLDSPKLTSQPPGLGPQRRANATTQPMPKASRASSQDAKPTDDTPIPPTTSLVKMFEQNRPSTPPGPPSSTPFIPYQSLPPVRSPKPRRTIKLPPEPQDGRPLEKQRTRTPPPVNTRSKPRLDISATHGMREEPSFTAVRKDSSAAPPSSKKPAQLAAVKNAGARPKPPARKFSRQTRPKSEDMARSSTSRQRRLSSAMSNYDTPSSPASFVSAQEEQEVAGREVAERPKPTLPPPRRSARQKSEAETRSKTATPLPTKPRAASKMLSPIPPFQSLPPRRASISGTITPTGTLYHSNYQRESVKAITKHMTGESLSSAIVGAALASSRNSSPNPSRISTPISMRKQHHHHSPFHRSPSPPKPHSTGKLRTTMRKDPSSSEDEGQSDRYKRKGTRIMGMGRKHPNKHHEGTRKRWRDQITDRERKRYEGVWAANKGLFIQTASSRSPARSPDEDPIFDVLNLVTKEIWSRSRLPEHELEEVWNLVDNQGVGRLRKEEFVVGMWLVDQRLKGRKIPAKVSESVWASVRGAGVKIKVGHR